MVVRRRSAATQADGPAASAVRLHIGGRQKRAGWTILNVVPGPNVDIVADARDLGRFADGSIAQIYASHVLEHFGHRQDLSRVLTEWRRVLAPGGELMISVPDLAAVCRMFVHPSRTPPERYHLMRVIYGGQTDEHDLHRCGFDFALLRDVLAATGFARIRRVESFGLFADTSDLVLFGERVSLNVVAAKPSAARAAAPGAPAAPAPRPGPPANCRPAPKASHVFGPRERLLVDPGVDVQSAFFNTISGTIRVGRFVMFGHDVKLLTGTHDVNARGLARIRAYPPSGRDIVIEEGAWLASGCIVLGGVTVGRNAVVAAGSVVTRSIPAEEIWGGNPARRIRKLDAPAR